MKETEQNFTQTVQDKVSVNQENQFKLIEKYHNYIIGLSVAAIGFSVHHTIFQPLKYVHVILVIAVILWIISIIMGFKIVKNKINEYSDLDEVWYQRLSLNSLQIIKTIEVKGKNKDVVLKKYSDDEIIHTKKLNELYGKLENYRNEQNILMKSQIWLFCVGIFIFLIWHIAEMYNNIC